MYLACAHTQAAFEAARNASHERAHPGAWARGERPLLKPVVGGTAGGPGIFFNRLALQAMERALDAGRCVDAPYGDVAVAGCARVAGVRVASLPGGFMVNHFGAALGRQGEVNARHPTTKFNGQIVSYHTLRPERALCWAEHGECAPQCNVTTPDGWKRSEWWRWAHQWKAAGQQTGGVLERLRHWRAADALAGFGGRGRGNKTRA